MTDWVALAAVAGKNGYGHYKKSIGGRSPSLRWPHLYDLLRAKGYDKEKAARISNAKVGQRKLGKLEGLPYKKADSKSALKGVLKKYEKKHGVRASAVGAIVAAFSPGQPRWPAGSPGGLGGQWMPDGDTPSASLAGITGGTGTKDDPFTTDSVETAAILLYRDEYVQLKQPRQISTLLDHLKAFVDDAKKDGAKEPTYDLCKATVPGTSLFCVESKGIPRVQMPQLSGKPEPGSPAAKLKANGRGEVDLGPAFREHLKSLGIGISEQKVDAAVLKATQNQLEGGKVAGIENAIETGDYTPASIFVTADDYIVDGHHRWAANVAHEYGNGKTMMMDVSVIDTGIITVLKLANDFAIQNGIRPSGADEFWRSPRWGGGVQASGALQDAIKAVRQGTVTE